MKFVLTFLQLFFIKMFLGICLFSNICLASELGDTIKPLPKINKEFLISCHSVLTYNGINMLDKYNLEAQMVIVNQLFEPIGVSFRICSYDSIFNYQYDSLTQDNLIHEEDRLHTEYGVDGRINFYFVDSLYFGCGNAVLGGVTMQRNADVILMNSCINPFTIGHELGHLFGLYHTFEDKFGEELINGSNCSTTGDLVCDTPADPYIFRNSISEKKAESCILYSDTDKNGNYYHTDISNLMSYYNCRCLTFTHGQYERMVKTYLSNPIIW
jgi:hypothetical protein